jgi:cyclic pyranopterin phosphate synthase
MLRFEFQHPELADGFSIRTRCGMESVETELPGFAQMIEERIATPSVHTLRLSVTDRCNLRCRYCMPDDGIPKLRRSELLSLEGLAAAARVLCRHLPIDRIKLTGGEPLVRAGLPHLISELAGIPGIREVSMTTNGTLLRKMVGDLKQSGLRRVNISLDSLDPFRFAEITRGGSLANALDGISAAMEADLQPVKLNAVLRRSTWRQDVPELLHFASMRGLEIRFIELMRTGTERLWCEGEYIAAIEVERWLADQVAVTTLVGHPRGPARGSIARWHGAEVRIGWITPQSRPFCSNCDRLRMDCRGRVFRCLMDERSFMFAELLRTTDDETVINALTKYLRGKSAPVVMGRDYSMASIGG